jgi:hypothetical protein
MELIGIKTKYFFCVGFFEEVMIAFIFRNNEGKNLNNAKGQTCLKAATQSQRV